MALHDKTLASSGGFVMENLVGRIRSRMPRYPYVFQIRKQGKSHLALHFPYAYFDFFGSLFI